VTFFIFNLFEPRFSVLQDMRQFRKIVSIGYPVGLGQRKLGVERTPKTLFAQHWFRKLTDAQILDIEEQPSSQLDARRLQALLLEKNRQLALNVSECFKQNHFPLVVGGCHTQAIGSVSAASEAFKNLKVVWIDAHLDANTPQDSMSGNYHGMPLGILSGNSV
jgi:arginase